MNIERTNTIYSKPISEYIQPNPQKDKNTQVQQEDIHRINLMSETISATFGEERKIPATLEIRYGGEALYTKQGFAQIWQTQVSFKNEKNQEITLENQHKAASTWFAYCLLTGKTEEALGLEHIYPNGFESNIQIDFLQDISNRYANIYTQIEKIKGLNDLERRSLICYLDYGFETALLLSSNEVASNIATCLQVGQKNLIDNSRNMTLEYAAAFRNTYRESEGDLALSVSKGKLAITTAEFATKSLQEIGYSDMVLLRDAKMGTSTIKARKRIEYMAKNNIFSKTLNNLILSR